MYLVLNSYKMSFHCYLCVNRLFKDNKEVVEHLKKEHKIREKIHKIKCTMKGSKCGKHFQTFYGLDRHVKTCLNDESNSDAEVCSKQPEFERLKSLEPPRPDSFIFNISNAANVTTSSGNDDTFVCDENNAGVQATSKTDQSFVLDSSKHSSGMQFETPYEATTNFFAGILQLNLTEKATTDIFRLTERLLNKTYQFCSQSSESHERIPLEALDCSISLTINGLKRFESSYRRK